MAGLFPRHRIGIRRAALALCTAAIALTAGFLAAGTASAVAPVPAVGTRAFSTDAAPLPLGAHATPISGAAPLHLTVSLIPSHPSALLALANELQSPSSPQYRHFLTEGQFQSEFAPPPGAASAVSSYFGAYGAHQFLATPDRLGVSFTISAAGAGAALHVSVVEYGKVGSHVLYTVEGTPTLPEPVASVVSGIDGLSDGGAVHPNLAMESPRPEESVRRGAGEFVYGGSGGPQWFIGSDFTQATGTSALFPTSATVTNATFPTREAVATIGVSSYNSTEQVELPPWDPSVVEQYFNDTFPTDWPHPTILGVDVPIDNYTAPPPGSFDNLNDSSGGDEYENSLDLEMAGSLAPGAQVVNFYFPAAVALDTVAGEYEPVANDFALTLAAALDYHYANATLTSVSISYALPDLNNSLWNTELLNAAATGVTIVAASGDQGDAPPGLTGSPLGQWPSWPGTAATDASGAVTVGGVSLSLLGVGTGTFLGGNLPDSFDGTVTGIQTESAWYNSGTLEGESDLGTEGGASSVTAEPSWQRDSAAQPAIVNATVTEQLASLGRAEPDIAGPANNTVAYIVNNSGTIYFSVFEGTSIASPVFAGMLASLAAAAGHRFGFLDPELYRIGSYFAAFPGPSDPYDSVTSGNNYLYSASGGWDPLTGWGTVNAPEFLAVDGNATIAGYQYSGSSPGLPPAQSTGSVSTSAGLYEPILLGVGLILTALIVLVIVVSARRRRGAGPVGPPPGATYHSYVTPSSGESPPVYPYSQNPSGPNPPNTPLPSGQSTYGWNWATGAPPPAKPLFATFSCPYCGFERPAEAGRCPHCGAF